jgi:hypothetical protein
MNDLQTAIFEQIQTLPTEHLITLATGNVDAQEIAKLQLANRGLDLEGKWIGFYAAEQAMLNVLNPKDSTESLEVQLGKIAKQQLSITTLETRKSDSLDFYEVSVWGIKAALEKAYQAGLQAR